MNRAVEKHYTDISFGENRTRLRLLSEFRDLAMQYFENSRLNMMDETMIEEQKASEARNAMNLIMKQAYTTIRLADIKTAATSSASLAYGGHGKNIDLIMNIFNISRNNIPHHAAIDYIERAIEVYRSNRLDSFIRTINPFFWIKTFLNYRRRIKKEPAD
ncbi:MAG: hypothetical protein AMK71_12905 [Nitrospira bacterium SG8_35_4]|nr:MAG: hypothetical protein AMK71_12905 [Nitrospira bacterium SG8_35_4]